MRQTIYFNKNWAFSKDASAVPAQMPDGWDVVNLPHTWNNVDGIDGGNDYHRGTCYYANTVDKKDFLPVADRYYLEFEGANSSATVYVNGNEMCHHDGGYSTFRVDVTNEFARCETPLVVVAVDNSANNKVYPQMADFTFYGGLYRDVKIICISESHFDLDYYGAPGIKVTPTVEGKNATVEVEVFVTNAKENQQLVYTLRRTCGKEMETKTVCASETKVVFEISDVHLWHGVKDPYLYSVDVQLADSETVLDNVSTRFGCRTFHIDPEEGFFLNGESYPLHGVSRHQDRWGTGNALLPEHHLEDMDLICEMGANTIRLAHYQHAQYFYDLCDERGMVVWAEIPYISRHMPTGRENTISQMKELVAQNYNHPSIVVWGLSNEISMQGTTPDLLENHKILNDLCHEMDKTRLTTIACVSPTPTNDPYIKIPDVVSYNHYFGWYGGDTSQNGPWFDDFHKVNPTIPVGCSEYGCEALNWHNSTPSQGDYTEEYQAFYHEELIKQLFSRKYIWSTHVWNMFDFGADARAEGGENGQNHKGLVTMDRKYKKDSFYAYKAWLSDDPFVHICGKRYVDRVEETTKVTVYSNQPEVELFANGVSLGKQTSDVHFFYFDVPNCGETKLEAVAGSCRDESFIRKVSEFNSAYRLVEVGAILNWFDVEMPEGYFSINDKIGDIGTTFRGKLFLAKLMSDFIRQMKKSQGESGNNLSDMAAGEGAKKMMAGFSVLRIITLAGGMLGLEYTKEDLLAMNKKLNRIRKPNK
ncbi:MAG: glycoside hydrolase family 2 protein [Oscillospiraceae bacterium]|nr:glycoside hydrolase family 2 protein [Oscillospiraceae bacterium]